MISKIKACFKDRYHEEPKIFRSPGRVNILGEHTDYNEGFVLPAAINKHIYIAITARNDDQIDLYASDFNENFITSTGSICPSTLHWPNYVLGVVDQLQKKGILIPGFNAVIDGDIPIGAGLSSSAAVECSTLFALNDLFSLGLHRIDMVPLAQKAEHEFAGVKCGIMDQFASMFGKKDHVIKLDCRSLEYEYLPLDLAGYKILLLNSNVKHNLASSEYNIRRQQCELGVSLVAAHHPTVKSLRDINIDMLKQFVEPADRLIYERCKYVVLENERLLGACEDLRHGKIEALGKKMFETHQGLSLHYGVSCKELDFLVSYTSRIPEVAGARMMGGGFGGCTINLVKDEAITPLVESISKDYEKQTGLPLTAYIAETGNGTEACL